MVVVEEKKAKEEAGEQRQRVKRSECPPKELQGGKTGWRYLVHRKSSALPKRPCTGWWRTGWLSKDLNPPSLEVNNFISRQSRWWEKYECCKAETADKH